VSFLEVEEAENLKNHDLNFNDLLDFQSLIIQELSKKLYGTKLSLNELTNMREPMKNIFLVDLIESLFNSGILSNELKNLKNNDKIKKLIQEVSPVMKTLI
jgi:hypothetical protein